MSGNKPSFVQQRDIPATDRKFRPEDEHLIAQNKEEIASGPHGDKLSHPAKGGEEKKGQNPDKPSAP